MVPTGHEIGDGTGSGTLYPAYYAAGIRPITPGYPSVGNPQQYIVVTPTVQQQIHPGVSVHPQVNMTMVSAPSNDLVPGPAAMQPLQPMYSHAPSWPPRMQAQPRQRVGTVWTDVTGRAGHTAAGVLTGQATSVEDILQLLRSMPRGASAIPAVADSLRYLDSRALAALLKELSKTGLREVAFGIFDWLRSLNGHMHPEYAGLLDVFTYTTMIAQCTNHVHLPTALELVNEMRSRSIPLNTHTYSSMLNVCVKSGEVEMALDVFNQMLVEGLQPNLVTYNTLLEVYAKRGMWREAVGVLDNLERQRLVPEPRTYNIVMNACNAARQYASCIKVHARMVFQKIPPTVGTYNAVILAHCKLDQLGAAQQVFREMQQQGCQPTHTTFITLLQTAETRGQAEVAVSLVEQMQSMSLRLTPQCYAAAIGACAAAGQLASARKLLSEMLASSKAGMAAPAHIIMGLQDKCCDWQGAFRTYQKLLASGVRPDNQTTATAIEALWSAGNIGSCLLALQVFEHACKQGVFRLAVSVHTAEPAVEFTLPITGTCMAIISLWRLLAELRGRVLRDGPRILRNSVAVLLGDGQSVVANLQAAMKQWCAVPSVPFVVRPSHGQQVLLTAQAAELAQWLMGEQSLMLCPVMPPAADLEHLPQQTLLDLEAVSLAECRQRLKDARSREAKLLHVNALPAAYSQARASLWQQLQTAAATLRPSQPQLPFLALVLLDQAAATGLLQQQGVEAAMSTVPEAWMLAASMLLGSQAATAITAAAAGSSASTSSNHTPLTEQQVAGQFDVTAEEMLVAVHRLRDACGAAVKANVCAYTVAELYLDAMLAGQLDRKVAASCLIGEALSLCAVAVKEASALEIPPSHLAAVVVAAGRQAQGLYPVWPKVLWVLTGISNPVGEMQQLLLQNLVLEAGRLP